MPRRPYKTCDGTWQDYHRHKRRDERPCSKSLIAHSKYVRERRLAQQTKGDKT